MEARRNDVAHFKPHRKSRLAFLVECVKLWCDDGDGTSFLDDPINVAAAKAALRKRVTARLSSVDADTIDHFAAVEFEAFQGALITGELTSHIRRLTTPRPKKGNVRREIPEHIPLRPSRAIIALHASSVARARPSLSRNGVYNETAEYFNDGIPKSEAGGRMKVRSVRTACEGFGLFDASDVMLGNYERARQRFLSAGLPHIWDCSFYDMMIWQRDYERRFSRAASAASDASDVQLRLTYLLRDLPLAMFDRLYDAARADRRYAGLLGIDLAHALDARVVIRAWVLHAMDTFAPPSLKDEGGTANVVR